MGITEQKARLREVFRRRAMELSEEERAVSDRAIGDAVLSSELWREARSVFLYISVKEEPDTRRLLSRAIEEGKAVYAPKCLRSPDGSPRMLAVRLRSPEDLVPGAFSIPEPRCDPEAPPEILPPDGIDLALLPCVSATKNGDRLGHGAGYYDRFLAEGRPGKPATVCLCRAALLSEELPAGPHDIPADCVATEDGLFFRSHGSR